jgi:hypothetical protein
MPVEFDALLDQIHARSIWVDLWVAGVVPDDAKRTASR